VYWYQKAADQGYAEAQSILGVMYANGKGVLKDLSKAKYWIKKAYEGGDLS
jgi:TPR repeat protein